jgi:hypothetical protein
MGERRDELAWCRWPYETIAVGVACNDRGESLQAGASHGAGRAERVARVGHAERSGRTDRHPLHSITTKDSA